MSNEQKKNASQNRRPRQSSTQKNKDGSDKKRSYKQQVEWKLHPVAEDKDLASNILKNTNMDIDLDEINLLLRSVDKQQPTAPEQDSVPEPCLLYTSGTAPARPLRQTRSVYLRRFGLPW